eukprot:SAG11_NODE_912_length_6580_cov_2.243018_4_plen_75_part_00
MANSPVQVCSSSQRWQCDRLRVLSDRFERHVHRRVFDGAGLPQLDGRSVPAGDRPDASLRRLRTCWRVALRSRD